MLDGINSFSIVFYISQLNGLALRRVMANINYVTANLRGLVTQRKLAKDKADKALSMLKGVLDYSEFKDVDMVIEVCSIKFQIFLGEFTFLFLKLLSFLNVRLGCFSFLFCSGISLFLE